MLEADPVAAGDSKRVDVVEREILDVSVVKFGAEERGVQVELLAASPDLGPQVLLPDGSVLEADVVICQNLLG